MFFDHCHCGHKCHEHRCNSGIRMIFAIASFLFTIGSIVFTIMVLCEKKRRKEDRELEDYLENSIQ